MIIPGSILLLAAVGAIESYTFNTQSNGPSFGYLSPMNQAQLQNPLLFQSNQRQFQQPSRYINRENDNQVLANIAAVQQSAPQLMQYQQSNRYNPVSQRAPSLQQNVNFVPRAQLHHGSAQQQPVHHQMFAPQVAATKSNTRPSGASGDFLSSLQIIDTHGRLRELKDFGLGGNGNEPHEPELERQLKSIFDTINRDLENAAFLPLDVNNAHQQLGNMFSNQYNQEQQKQVAYQNQQQQVTKDLRAPQLVATPVQEVSSKTQPKEVRYQFLKPLRSKKVEQQAEQPIRSPVQAIRNEQNIQKTFEEQRHIEQVQQQPDGFDSPAISAPVEQAQFAQKQEEVPQREIVNAHHPTKGQQVVHSGDQQQLRYEQKQQSQPAPVLPSVQKSSNNFQHFEQLQEQKFDDQQTNLKDFDDDAPLPEKTRNPRRQKVNQHPKARPEFKVTQEQTYVSQAEIDSLPNVQQSNEPQQAEIHLERQQEYDDKSDNVPVQPVQQVKTNVKKFEGWVPMVRQQQVPALQQQSISSGSGDFEPQVKDDGNYAPIVQQKEEQKVEQERNEPLLEQVKVESGFNEPENKSPIVQQQPIKEPGKFNKLKKQFSKIAATAKSKLGGSSNTFQPTLQQQPEIFSQQQEVIQEQEPIQQVQQVEQSSSSAADQFDQGARKQQLTVANFEKQKKVDFRTQQQREDSQAELITTPPTPKPIQRGQVKGRKVKIQLTEKNKTPVQKYREQQTKSKQQQQQSQTSDFKRPRQFVEQAAKQTSNTRLQEFQQVRVETPERANLDETSTPVYATTIQESPKFPEQTRLEIVSQQQQTVKDSADIAQEQIPQLNQEDVSQKQEVKQSQVQEKLTIPRDEVITSQKEIQQENLQQREEIPQQKEELNQQKEEQVQQKEDLPQQSEELNQNREDSKQKEETPQIREEVAQQKEETSIQQPSQVQDGITKQVKQDETVQQFQENTPEQVNQQQEAQTQQSEPNQAQITDQRTQDDNNQANLQTSQQETRQEDNGATTTQQFDKQDQDQQQQTLQTTTEDSTLR